MNRGNRGALKADLAPVIAALGEEACWLIGPTELALRGIQERLDAGAGRRTALRALFGSER